MNQPISIADKRRIALAYDGTEDAHKLLQWSIKNIIQPRTDHVILLYALARDYDSSSPPLGGSDAHADGSRVGQSSRKQLLEASSEMRKLQISSEDHLLWGEPKTALPRYTQSNKIDLLIVGSRGLGVMKGVFLGSVSDRCVHECPCPVLVVRHTTI